MTGQVPVVSDVVGVAMELARRGVDESEAKWLVDCATPLIDDDIDQETRHRAIGAVRMAIRQDGEDR